MYKQFNMETTTQHVQIENNLCINLDGNELSYTDILVYACMKKYMNKDNFRCYPSLTTVCEDTSLSRPSVTKSIKALIKSGDIKLHGRVRRNNVYQFNPTSKNFERYSYNFLNDQNLTAKEKAFYIIMQPLLYKDGKEGATTYSYKDIADLTGLDRRIVSDRSKELEQKGIIIKKTVINKDGNSTVMTIYDLSKVHQDLLFIKEQTEENTSRIESLEKRQEKIVKEIEELKKLKVG